MKKSTLQCSAFKRNVALYLMLVVPLIYFIVFKYFPLYGIQLAFRDYNVGGGVSKSPWVGLRNFQYLLYNPDFLRAVRNNVILSFLRIFIGFPMGIIIAISLSELPMQMRRGKTIFQTIFTFPHFLSWVIVSGLILNLLGSAGVVNALRLLLNLEPKQYLTDKYAFIWILIYSDIWKEAGWGAIIYLAVIAGLPRELFEAADIDGATRLQKIQHVTLPGLKSIMVVMLIVSVGSVLNVGFDQIFNMYNPAVYETTDIIDTYVYRASFRQSLDFGIGTAVGLFKGIVNFALLYTANKVARAMGEAGING